MKDKEAHVPGVGKKGGIKHSVKVGRRRDKKRNIFEKIIKSLDKGLFWDKVFRRAMGKHWVNVAAGWFFRKIFKINPHKIVFITFARTYSCNPRYITEALLRHGYSGEIVWLVGHDKIEDARERQPDQRVRFVPFFSLRALYEIMTARCWIENAQMFVFAEIPCKRAGQIYCNTWHGSLGIKRLDTADHHVRARAVRARERTDYCFTNSDFEDKVLEASFFSGVPKVQLGHARNDLFFLPEAERSRRRSSLLTGLGLDPANKIALFAPTFREKYIFTCYREMDFSAWREALRTRFGGEWIIVIKLHPHDAKMLSGKDDALPENVINLSKFGDIQELAEAADVAVTDYSSWIFDFMLTGRPGFIYAPDLEVYNTERGFYYPLEETPFPIARNDREFCDNVIGFDAERYSCDLKAFLDVRGCRDDGNAGERTVKFLEKILA